MSDENIELSDETMKQLREAGFSEAAGSLSDGDRLEWAVTHSATVKIGERMKTRRGGFDPENLETVYQCEWINDAGDLILQSVDCRYQTMREALDAAILSENAKPRCEGTSAPTTKDDK